MRRMIKTLLAAAFVLGAVASPAWAIGEVQWWLRAEDERGNPVASPKCIIYTAGSTTQATIYSDDQGTSKTNDFTGSSTTGECEWFLPVSTTSVDVLVYSGSRSWKEASFLRTDHRIVLRAQGVARQRSVALPLPSFCSDTGTACIPLTNATEPSMEESISSGGNIPVVKWDDNEATPASINFRVPLDFLEAGQLRLIMSTEATGQGVAAYYDYDTYVSTINGSTALDTSVTNPAAAQLTISASAGGQGSPEEVTLTPADWSALSAGQLVTARVFRDDTTASDLYLWHAEFIYTAKE